MGLSDTFKKLVGIEDVEDEFDEEEVEAEKERISRESVRRTQTEYKAPKSVPVSDTSKAVPIYIRDAFPPGYYDVHLGRDGINRPVLFDKPDNHRTRQQLRLFILVLLTEGEESVYEGCACKNQCKSCHYECELHKM